PLVLTPFPYTPLFRSLDPSFAISEYTARLPILVIGIPGVPGFNAFFHLRARFPGSVIAMAPPNAPQLTAPGSPFGPGIVAADPRSEEHTSELQSRENL